MKHVNIIRPWGCPCLEYTRILRDLCSVLEDITIQETRSLISSMQVNTFLQCSQ
jgi:hypothetical protein